MCPTSKVAMQQMKKIQSPKDKADAKRRRCFNNAPEKQKIHRQKDEIWRRNSRWFHVQILWSTTTSRKENRVSGVLENLQQVWEKGSLVCVSSREESKSV